MPTTGATEPDLYTMDVSDNENSRSLRAWLSDAASRFRIQKKLYSNLYELLGESERSAPDYYSFWLASANSMSALDSVGHKFIAPTGTCKIGFLVAQQRCSFRMNHLQLPQLFILNLVSIPDPCKYPLKSPHLS
jgi:hypothetical protein